MSGIEPYKNEYSREFSEDGFWKKLAKYALAAGKDVVEKALLLYYAFQNADTPTWAKGVIVGALGYFIMPVDAIPDIIPVVGYADDLGVLVAAIATVAAYITPEVHEQAKDKITQWFGEENVDERRG